MKKIFLLSLIILILTGCNGISKSPFVTKQPDENYRTFRSEAIGINFQYPASWDAPLEDPYSQEVFIMKDKDQNCTGGLGGCDGLFVKIGAEHENQFLSRIYSSSDEEECTDSLEKKKEVMRRGDLSNIVLRKKGYKDGFLTMKMSDRPNTPYEFALVIWGNDNRLYIFEMRGRGWFGQYDIHIEHEDRYAEAWHTIEAIFDNIIETFQEIPQKTIVSPQLPIDKGPQYIFQRCGDTDDFHQETFYQQFLEKIHEIPFARTPVKKLSIGSEKIEEHNINQLCYSQEGNMLIAIVSKYGHYDILKYTLITEEIAFAEKWAGEKLISPGSFYSIEDFGNQNNSYIEVIENRGKLGNRILHYYYNHNILIAPEEGDVL